MLPNDYEGQNCSVAATLEIVGERWTLLILRDAFAGARRFDDFQRRLGIAPNILGSRLRRLVAAAILERRPYQDRPARYEYRLTDKGRDLWPVVNALRAWGDLHLMDGGPPLIVRHRDCGGEVDLRSHCTRCGAAIGPRECRTEAGPRAATGRATAAQTA